MTAGSPHPPAPSAGATSPQGGEARVRVLSVLVEDGPNTLSKVSGVIRRRGFHVLSISVGPSPEPGRSRLTLQVDHGHAEADQVRKQLERLVEVVEVEDLTGHDLHSRELVVARVASADLSELLEKGASVRGGLRGDGRHGADPGRWPGQAVPRVDRDPSSAALDADVRARFRDP